MQCYSCMHILYTSPQYTVHWKILYSTSLVLAHWSGKLCFAPGLFIYLFYSYWTLHFTECYTVLLHSPQNEQTDNEPNLCDVHRRTRASHNSPMLSAQKITKNWSVVHSFCQEIFRFQKIIVLFQNSTYWCKLSQEYICNMYYSLSSKQHQSSSILINSFLH